MAATEAEGTVTQGAAPRSKPPWIFIGLALFVIAALVGVAFVLTSGVLKSPADVVQDFYDANKTRDAELMESTVSENLWLTLGWDIFDTVPADMRTDFAIEQAGETARATQSGGDWELVLDLAKDDRWYIDSIQLVRIASSETTYEVEDRTVETEYLRKDVEQVLSSGTPGTRELTTRTYYANGSHVREEQSEGDVILEAKPGLVVRGTGPLVGGRSGSAQFSNQIWFQRYEFTSGFVTAQAHSAGDVFQPFMVMPSGDVIRGDEVEWDGEWDEEAFVLPGAPRGKTLAWEWTTEYMADAGFEQLVEGGWPTGTYIIGLTVNDEPLAASVDDVP